MKAPARSPTLNKKSCKCINRRLKLLKYPLQKDINMALIIAVGLLLSIILLYCVYSKWKFQHWTRKGVPQLNPRLFFGDTLPLVRGQALKDFHLGLYQKFKSTGAKCVGIYNAHMPELVPIDIILLKDIMVKDYSYFSSHGVFYHEKNVLTSHLFNIEGQSWKERRTKLTPVFTSETLRKYPTVPVIPRRCTKDYQIKNTNTVIDKGTRLYIPVIGVHLDPEYYPDPERFDPERFSPENKAKRPDIAWMPFGEGPRQCLGMRFGLLQSKVALASLLPTFRFTINKAMKPPYIADAGTLVYMFKQDVLLDATRIN
ncbi:hypothetical protein YQE_02814, partial [Dendroctonus ponderosae]